jgi:hypothetical protein
MSKIAKVVVVIGLIIIVYLLMLVIMPVVVDIVETANTTINATSNLTQYPGASEGLVSVPWILWFVPGGIGLAAIIYILKQP